MKHFAPLLAPVVVAGIVFAAGQPARAATACAPPVARYEVTLPGRPFGAIQSPDGANVFVAVTADRPTAPNGIAVLRCVAGRYAVAHLLPLESDPVAIASTRDGRFLLVADDAFVVLLDQRAAIAGGPAFLGFLQDAQGDPEDNDAGAVHVSLSPDDRFAFVADEQNDTITVIDMAKARAGMSRAAIVGQIPVANAPIALVFSRDGKTLFTTAEVALKKQNYANACAQEGGTSNALVRPPGVIAAIDVAKAETDPEHSVIAQVPGGCSPVRMAIAPNGKTLYVTNRNSNSVSVYSAAAVIAGASDALTATVPVGSGPVAVAATADGRYVLAGNSNRFGTGGPSNGTLSVISTSTLKVIGEIPTGIFPREMANGAGSMILLSNNRSNTLTVLDGSRIDKMVTPISP